MSTVEYVTRDLSVNYGKVAAVHGLSFEVPAGGALGIVGHNGAGKSSTLLALAGAVASEGTVRGHPCRSSARMDPGARAGTARAGRPDEGISLALVPEREKVFGLLSVHENLLAVNAAPRPGMVGIDDVYGFFPRLAERRDTIAGNLSGGEQQMLAIGAALLQQPDILLADEPTLGLAVPVIEMVCERLAHIRRALGLTLIVALAETSWVSHLADRAFVLDCGERISGYIDASDGMREQLERYLSGESRDPSPAGAHPLRSVADPCSNGEAAHA